MLGRSLEEFVGENFLPGAGHPRPGRSVAEPAAQGRGLAGRRRPTPAASCARAPSCCGSALERVKDEDVARLRAGRCWCRGSCEEPISPLAGSLLKEVVADGAHHGLVDLVLDEAHRWLGGNEDDLLRRRRRARAVVGPEALNERVIHRLHTELVDLARRHPHATRTTAPGWRSTGCSSELADGLLARPGHDRPDGAAQGAVPRPPAGDRDVHLAVERAAPRRWSPPSTTRTATSCAGGVAGAGRVRRAAARRRSALRDRLDERAADLAVFLVDRYGRELTAVITHTIDQWDGREASRQDRAARRQGPAVHPDQRHDRRRPRRGPDPCRTVAL